MFSTLPFTAIYIIAELNHFYYSIQIFILCFLFIIFDKHIYLFYKQKREGHSSLLIKGCY